MKESGFVFALIYHLYANTRLGLWYHRRKLAKLKSKQAQDEFHAHSEVQGELIGEIRVVPIPFGEDNYCYIIIHPKSNSVAVVDPGDAEPCRAYLEENFLRPNAFLLTHRHWDHCGGVEELIGAYPDAFVYGSAIDKAVGVNKFLNDRESISIGELQFVALLTPGHTKGHMVYCLDGAKFNCSEMIFTGDLLFFAGCGKVFEGTAEEMLKSLDLVSKYGDETLLWPGHEYAIDNVSFANTIDPENPVLQKKSAWTYDQRRERLRTCPMKLGDEKKYNPFLRIADSAILQHLGMVDKVDKKIEEPEENSSEKSAADEKSAEKAAADKKSAEKNRRRKRKM